MLSKGSKIIYICPKCQVSNTKDYEKVYCQDKIQITSIEQYLGILNSHLVSHTPQKDF